MINLIILNQKKINLLSYLWKDKNFMTHIKNVGPGGEIESFDGLENPHSNVIFRRAIRGVYHN
jgi:hypothetical protein